MILATRSSRQFHQLELLTAVILLIVTAQTHAQRTLDNTDRRSVALPEPAQQIRERFERQREQAIAELQTLARTYADRGSPAEAAAINLEIRRLSAAVPKAAVGPADGPQLRPVDPVNFSGFRDRVGKSYLFVVTGSKEGVIWGTDLYTDDSSPAAAAVHAGLVKPGEQRAITVTFVEGAEAYTGSTRNGVLSNPYQHWFGSYRLSPAPAGIDASVAAYQVSGALSGFRGHEGEMMLFDVTGSTVRTIWGDGIYTDDSPLAVAAVHAGILHDGQRGIIAVVLRPGRDSYPSTAGNGVTSQPFGPFASSYEILKTNTFKAAPPLESLRNNVGDVLYLELVGSSVGSVWGTGVYTDDSSLPAAAVHAGALADGEKGIVRITICAPPTSFAGSSRNGIVSQDYGTFGGCFRIERVPADTRPTTIYRYEPVRLIDR